MNLPLLKLKQDVETHWNSVAYMCLRLTEVKVPLTVALSSLQNFPDQLMHSEWDLVHDLAVLLGYFTQVTEPLSGERYPTNFLVIPLVRGLQSSINATGAACELGNALKCKLLDVINKRMVC